MFRNKETSPSGRDTDIPQRSTTPTGDPPPGAIDFATMHRTGTIPGITKDFASRQGFNVGEEYTIADNIEQLKKEGLYGKVRVLEPPYEMFSCHQLTFFNGGNRDIDDETIARYIEKDFKPLNTKDQYKSNPSLFQDLADRVEEDKNKNGGHVLHYIVVYRRGRDVTKRGYDITHSTPIEKVYWKEDGTPSIEVWGKWGPGRSLFTHDIEDVPPGYRDFDNEAKWEIRYTNQPNGRLMDL